jgi:hypothetical protein
MCESRRLFGLQPQAWTTGSGMPVAHACLLCLLDDFRARCVGAFCDSLMHFLPPPSAINANYGGNLVFSVYL